MFHSSVHELSFLCTVFMSQLLTQATLGNTLVPIHVVSDDLGVANDGQGTQQLPWFVAAYSLTVGVCMLVTGRIGAVYGYRRVYVAGMAWFAVASTAVGLAAYTHSVEYFDVWRALQGVGPALTIPNGVALLASAYSHSTRKTLVFALFGATAPSGFVLGATFGSLWADLSWWPWAQWVLAMVCVVIALLAEFVVVPEEINGAHQPEGKLDVPGAVTGILGLVLLVYAWNEGPIVGWDEPYVFVLLIVAALILGLFLFVESRADEDTAIMPLSIWMQPTFPGVIACVGLGWASFGVWSFYLVQLQEIQRGSSPLLVSAQFAPICLTGLMATLLMSRLHHRVGGHIIMGLAMVAFCGGNILLAVASLEPNETYWAYIFTSLCIAPFGMDMSYPAASLIISNALPPKWQGVGASMVNSVVNVSISLGLGVAGTVERQLKVGGASALVAQRGASYVGIGLAALGIFVALLFCRVPISMQQGSTKNAGSEHRSGQFSEQSTNSDGSHSSFTSGGAFDAALPSSSVPHREHVQVEMVPSNHQAIEESVSTVMWHAEV